MANRRQGQMAITMVLSILLFLMLMFPVMNLFVQNEGRWSVKEKKSTTAFHLAEAGIDRARWKLMENDDFWYITATGTLAGYHFDQVYEGDTAGGAGTYTINISSDPIDSTKRIVESVGRDKTNSQIRRIRAVLVNDNNANFATRAANMVANTGGNDHIELGPVISGNSIATCTGNGPCTAADTNFRIFPRYYSAGHVTPQDGGSTAASTDDIYWWSYYDVPPFPKVDFSAYISSADASDALYGGAPNGCGKATGAKYHHTALMGPAEFIGCQDTSGRTYYIDPDINVTFKSGPGKSNFIRGTIIMQGNFIISGNGGANGSYQAKLPPQAWKEYGHNEDTWDHYRDDFDPGCPHDTYAEAVSANYVATGVTYPLSNVLIHGFAYTGGNQGLSGGGNCNINGVLLSNQNATMGTSTMGIYYDDGVAQDIMMQGVVIKLHSWYEVKAEWPAGL